MKDLSIIFQGDNLRYLIELRGSTFSRLYYNKISILLFELGRFLSFYSPRLYFAESLLIIFFPLWLSGIFALIFEKRWKVFTVLLLSGIPVYFIDKRDFISLLPITAVYAYITLVGTKYVISKWQKLK